jgi:anti-sigma regulatory factor (Ser/Thr protein kinase)
VTGKATFEVANVPEDVAAAREAVSEATAGRIDSATLQTARLLVSELVTNGILHGAGDQPLLVEIETGDFGLRINVTDSGQTFTLRRAAGPDESGGWGLFLVDELADRWGIVRNGNTCVWFELDPRKCDTR